MWPKDVQKVKGKYSTAKIFTDLVDEASLAQVKLLCDQEFTKGSKIRMMPDIHAGAGCTIGTTMTITDKIVPNLVGVDIGCGMLTAELVNKNIDLKRLDEVIHEQIPAGRNIHDNTPSLNDNSSIRAWRRRLSGLYAAQCGAVDIERALCSLGTLGGGNHFIEVDVDDDDSLYLVIHTGSRHLGVEVATFYQQMATKQFDASERGYAQSISTMISKLKAQGKEQEIQSRLESFKKEWTKNRPPKELDYVSGDMMEHYLHDIRTVQLFAKCNREWILETLCRALNLCDIFPFHTVHNYIDPYNKILRKGAAPAYAGQDLLIPMNMRDGSLICTGKGNREWNYSAPHGAGRIMSRSEAKRNLDLAQFEKEMQGIYTTSVSNDTIDESPMAYKPMESIVESIKPTVNIIKVIKPDYNFKAGE